MPSNLPTLGELFDVKIINHLQTTETDLLCLDQGHQKVRARYMFWKACIPISLEYEHSFLKQFNFYISSHTMTLMQHGLFFLNIAKLREKRKSTLYVYLFCKRIHPLLVFDILLQGRFSANMLYNDVVKKKIISGTLQTTFWTLQPLHLKRSLAKNNLLPNKYT